MRRIIFFFISILVSFNAFSFDNNSIKKQSYDFESELKKDIFSSSDIILSITEKQSLRSIQNSFITGDRELILVALVNRLLELKSREIKSDGRNEEIKRLTSRLKEVINNEIETNIKAGIDFSSAIDMAYAEARTFFPEGYEKHFEGLKVLVEDIFLSIKKQNGLVENLNQDLLDSSERFSLFPKIPSFENLNKLFMVHDHVTDLSELNDSFVEFLKGAERIENVKNDTIDGNRYFLNNLTSEINVTAVPAIINEQAIQSYTNNNTKVSPFWDELSKKVGRKPSYPRREFHSEVGKFHEEEFSSNVKFSFMGSEISAGPVFTFKRNYSGALKLMAHGEDIPIINADSILNHNEDRRIYVLCSITSKSSTDVVGKSSVKVFNLGGSFSMGTSGYVAVKQSVMFHAPFTNEYGEETTVNDLANFCTKDYFKAIKKSLDFELKLGMSQLVFEHKKNQCKKHSDCGEWFKQLPLRSREVTTAVCINEKENKVPINRCRLRALKNAPCPYYQEGEKVTNSIYERPCNKGLSCKLVKKQWWIFSAKAFCF